jgi:tetratricopeptide (TPR) repeat protein
MTRAHQTLCDKDARQEYILARSSGGGSANPGAPQRARRDVVRDVQTALQNRQFELAREFADELVAQSDADDAEALSLHAWVSVRAGEATEDELRAALPKLDRAVNLDRTCDWAVYHRGMLHKRLNNLQPAFRDFARAVQLNPNNIDAEREVRIFAMRVRKGSGEHKMIAPLLDKLNDKK